MWHSDLTPNKTRKRLEFGLQSGQYICQQVVFELAVVAFLVACQSAWKKTFEMASKVAFKFSSKLAFELATEVAF